MLRYAVKTAVLNRVKSKSPLGLLSTRDYSAESAKPEKKEEAPLDEPQTPSREESERLSEFRNKLKEDMAAMELSRYNLMTPVENDPMPPWPNNVNPHTGEIGGPRGPEPTRYGDWERKGICVDF